MLQLKEYQQRTLDTLQAYFRECQQRNDADLAFYQITRQTFGQGLPYRGVKELPGLPYVCLRIPTGGGKTLVACHAVAIAAHEFLHSDTPLVVWLTPSNPIRDQTLKALSDPQHPYRQALEATAGPTHVMDLGQAHYLQPATLNSGVTIIVATMQAFRVTDTEGRKVYEASGTLMPHFSDLPPELITGLDCVEGKPVFSLANVLALRRPILVVDEAHNSRTSLSFETLARFNPACILEFTATPDTQRSPSNVLHSVSAAELKAEAMIKMPIRLRIRGQWKELLADAIDQRGRLEAAARLEQAESGEYIRPIMLLQAQARSQQKETLTVEVVRQTLLDDFKIPANQIARATGETDELEGTDLSDPRCPIRFIVTVQALREGWDCPFAYVLCSVMESRSNTAVEQILGRILRLPHARRKQHEALNLAYAFSASAEFGLISSQLREGLVQNGFEKQEAHDMIQTVQSDQPELPLFNPRHSLPHPVQITVAGVPALDLLPFELAAKLHYDPGTASVVVTDGLDPQECRLLRDTLPGQAAKTALDAVMGQIVQVDERSVLSPAERGEVLKVPQLLIRKGAQLKLFEDTAFLSVPWRLSQCDFHLSSGEYSGKRADAREMQFDISTQGEVKQEFIPALQRAMTLFTADLDWTPADLVYWLDHAIPHPDIVWSESNPFLTRLVMDLIDARGLNLDQLVLDKYRLRDAVATKINAHRQVAHQRAYQSFLLPEYQTPLVVDPERCFTFPPDAYPYNTLYRGKYPFQKHYYPQIGDLGEQGEEFDCAAFLDGLPEVKYWVRNLERRPSHSFWLQTSTDRFYPDFVCLLNDGRYMVVEYKGEDRWTNDDSREKRIIGEVWEKRSGGKCVFIMPRAQDRVVIREKAQSSYCV
jgi:type III restriction enzyme